MSKVWFITGSSRGLGRSLTEAVLAGGDSVAATARNPEQLKDLLEKYPEQVYPLQLDVTSKAQILAAVENTVMKFGRIDVLVNNAGFGIIGATEAYTDEQVRSQLETNLYAPIAITRAVLPYMRKQRSGRILQISSVGGRVGNAGLTIYQAAKFGLGGFSEALAKEVAPLGIKVTSVEPGGFRTDWVTTSAMYDVPEVEGYETTVGVRRELFTGGKFMPMGDPDKAAQAMIALVQDPEPPVHLVLGSEAIGMIKQANALRNEEMEKWMPVSFSTNAGDAEDLTKTEMGKSFFGAKK
ncbi:oxidoreductase [Mucilaginibacter gotjawali]|uniref:3-oxoacyl-[acyl-carrier-protein] reductase FabG n=2 Tax=Mucilaginibacter gotjawali TaxID=1550579 RepID=A0A110B371_9SPHI|nr:oxidoreductase [Mucilaginibacter gotjawali]MBB3058208.1 NAD(P)-dependent dehydrogenase (short-subunit alcohol dehydrogenase family) [Mucilaginibacter gotjawali]BAU54836.1 3-oxoacyl-[acyl-carrier-protein] reductase FabG [Mucilaginibacter gotjawali]